MVDHNLVAEEVEVGPNVVYVMYDNDCDVEPFDCDMPDTWGIDLSNHRDFKSPTYGAEFPMDVPTYLSMRAEREDGEWEEDKRAFEKVNEEYVVLPVYMYEHSGRTVSTEPFSCPWDSGLAGIVYISKEDAVAHGVIAEEFLKNTVKELDYHLTGQVYGYIVEDDVGQEIDSCWGFIGELEYAKEAGVSSAKHLVHED